MSRGRISAARRGGPWQQPDQPEAEGGDASYDGDRDGPGVARAVGGALGEVNGGDDSGTDPGGELLTAESDPLALPASSGATWPVATS